MALERLVERGVTYWDGVALTLFGRESSVVPAEAAHASSGQSTLES